MATTRGHLRRCQQPPEVWAVLACSLGGSHCRSQPINRKVSLGGARACSASSARPANLKGTLSPHRAPMALQGSGRALQGLACPAGGSPCP